MLTPRKIQQQMDEMFRLVAEYTPKLHALMPRITEIRGDPDGQMHLTMTDFDSCEAARVTLERFGARVVAYSVPEPTQWFIRFDDEATADEAIDFYNRLPKKMKNYKPKPAKAAKPTKKS